MTTASPYVSTKNTVIPDRTASSFLKVYGGITYDVSYNGLLNYILTNGSTYLTPFSPNIFFDFVSSTRYLGLTLSSYAQNAFAFAKGLPPHRRGLQNFNTVAYTNYWDGDGITISGRNYNGYTGNWSTQLFTNSFPGVWPIKGLTKASELLADWLKGACGLGITYAALMIDNEGTDYEPSGLATDLSDGLKNDPRYNQTYFGLTSWAEIYSSYGGTGNPAANGTNQMAWWAAKDAYQAKIFQLSYMETMLKYNPNSIISNYTYFTEDEPRQFEGQRNSVWPQDGTSQPHLLPGGNAQAPELYGGMRSTHNLRIVKIIDGKHLDNPSIGITNNFRPFNKLMTRGPWASFVLTLAEARSAKRGRPDLPLTPWIGSVDWCGPEYNRNGLDYEIEGKYDWGGSFVQSPPEVLNTTYYRNKLTVSSGYTAYDGSTAAFRIVTNTNGSIGITNASLEYYLNGITHGLTYVFSYYTDLNNGFTNPSNVYQKIEHFAKWTYNYPRGITFTRTLPSITGPFFNVASANYDGYSGWTKVEYKFTTVKNLPDISDNLTLSLSVFGCCGSTSEVSGKTAFFSHPTLEIESSPSNIPLFVRSATDEYNFIDWATSPPSGFAHVPILGYNPRQAIYITEFPGHSGYYYDYIRHLALLGTKYFGYFNPSQFTNYGFTGSLQTWVNTGKHPNSYFNSAQALDAGWTGFLDDQKEFENCLHDINQRLGGFTTTTADYSEYDWNSTYMAHGAPSLNGNTWWWRVTVKPGYTMICNGVTLSSLSGYPVGTWISATGPTLAGIGITWKAWELPQEPGYTAPLRQFNFVGMTYNNRVKEVGFNFTRSTTATYIGSSGYLMTASVNEPRLDYEQITLKPKGLLLEPKGTNLLNWSESFAISGGCNNNWIDLRISRTTGNTSPSNSLNAIRFTATGSNAIIMATNGVSSGQIYGAWSCWFRGITGNENLFITLDGGTTWKGISNLTNYWKRHGSDMTMTEFGMKTDFYHMGFKLGNTNDSVEIWGAQVEQRRDNVSATTNLNPLECVDYTSYIPSGATQGFRADENCTMSGTSFQSWFGNTQGTILFETENVSQLSISQSTSYNKAYLYSVGHLVRFADYNVATTQTSCPTLVYQQSPQSGYPKNYPIKAIISYSLHGNKISSNGNLGSSSLLGLTQAYNNFTNLNLAIIYGQQWDRVNSAQHIRNIMYWDYIWNDEDMKKMSLANVEKITRFNPYG